MILVLWWSSNAASASKTQKTQMQMGQDDLGRPVSLHIIICYWSGGGKVTNLSFPEYHSAHI